jgi:hypothetical protein
VPYYDFSCPAHGRFEEHLRMDAPVLEAGASLCPVCGDWSPRVYTPPTVQNLSASGGTLVSWGRNMRPKGSVPLREFIARERAQAAREG